MAEVPIICTKKKVSRKSRECQSSASQLTKLFGGTIVILSNEKFKTMTDQLPSLQGDDGSELKQVIKSRKTKKKKMRVGPPMELVRESDRTIPFFHLNEKQWKFIPLQEVQLHYKDTQNSKTLSIHKTFHVLGKNPDNPEKRMSRIVSLDDAYRLQKDFQMEVQGGVDLAKLIQEKTERQEAKKKKVVPVV